MLTWVTGSVISQVLLTCFLTLSLYFLQSPLKWGHYHALSQMSNLPQVTHILETSVPLHMRPCFTTPCPGWSACSADPCPALGGELGRSQGHLVLLPMLCSSLELGGW